MQACGLVNDHLGGCAFRDEVEAERRRAVDGLEALGAWPRPSPRESVSARLAEVREGLTLLADYL